MVIGLGIDLVDVSDFRKKLSNELISELFLPEEIKYCRSQVRFWENFAGRFAAKEATFKSLSSGLSSGIRFRDVEVVKDHETGSVSLRLFNKALKLQNALGITTFHLSISHTKNNAIAVVIAEKK